MQWTWSDYQAFGGPWAQELAVRHCPTDTELPLGRVSWGDWDHQGRLVFARDGKLQTARLDGPRPPEIEVLADFNDGTFAPLATPAWATRW